MQTTREIPACILVLILCVLVAACGSSSSSTPEPERPRTAAPPETSEPAVPDRSAWPEIVRTYTDQFYAGELEALFSRFTEEMKQEVPLDKLRGMHQELATRFGRQIEVLGEDSQTQGDYRGFVRWARFEKSDAVVEIQWILTRDDAIAGLLIQQRRGGMSG